MVAVERRDTKEVERLISQLILARCHLRPPAVDMLIEYGDVGVAQLIEAIGHPVWTVRYWATYVLLMVHATQAVSTFEDRLKVECVPSVRDMLYYALRELGAPSGWPIRTAAELAPLSHRPKHSGAVPKAWDRTAAAPDQVDPASHDFSKIGLYHLTHVKNLTSILQLGLLAKKHSSLVAPDYASLALETVQDLRARVAIEYMTWGFGRTPPRPARRFVHSFVPLFFTPLTPMLYKRLEQQGDIAILKISPWPLLADEDTFFTDGNIAVKVPRDPTVKVVVTTSSDGHPSRRRHFTDGHFIEIRTSHEYTNVYAGVKNLVHVPWKVIKAAYWTDYPDGSRQRSAEVLVADRIEAARIERIGVIDSSAQRRAQRAVENSPVPINVAVQPGWFFH